MARFAWLLAGCLLLGAAGYGGVLCLFGWEAVATGANVPGWLGGFALAFLLPLAGSAFCFYRAARGRRG